MDLLSYFSEGTQRTVSGGMVGIEVETQFALVGGRRPIPPQIGTQLCTILTEGCKVEHELGYQNIELSVDPQPTFRQLYDKTRAWLDTLSMGLRHLGGIDYLGLGAVYNPAPFLYFDEPLLYTADERDKRWLDVDGPDALEHLARCSSIQFTVDVNPADAIGWINRLWRAKVHEQDYEVNHLLWKLYVAQSRAGYRPDRYGGPPGFEDLGDYVAHLNEHTAVMPGDEDMFLRSVWWHYRLRRYGDSLCLEIRPQSRRRDEDIQEQWRHVAGILGL